MLTPLDFKLATSVDSSVPKERWIASLSNGETIHENNFKHLVPAWERLSKFCEATGLYITKLRLLIAGTEVKLPSHQEGYLQKKIAWTTMQQNGVSKCVGYVQNGLALIYKVSSDKDFTSERTIDPGRPWTIYRTES